MTKPKTPPYLTKAQKMDIQKYIHVYRSHFSEVQQHTMEKRAARRERARANAKYIREARARGDAKVPIRRAGAWSEDEDATVMRTDVGIRELACILGRSAMSVRGRRQRLRKRADDERRAEILARALDSFNQKRLNTVGAR
jgi:hypothetical protein